MGPLSDGAIYIISPPFGAKSGHWEKKLRQQLKSLTTVVGYTSIKNIGLAVIVIL